MAAGDIEVGKRCKKYQGKEIQGSKAPVCCIYEGLRKSCECLYRAMIKEILEENKSRKIDAKKGNGQIMMHDPKRG